MSQITREHVAAVAKLVELLEKGGRAGYLRANGSEVKGAWVFALGFAMDAVREMLAAHNTTAEG